MLATKSTSACRDGSASAGCHAGSQPGSADSCAVTQRSKSCTACQRKVGRSLTTRPSRSMFGAVEHPAKLGHGVGADDAVDVDGCVARRPRARNTPQTHRATSRRPAGVVTSSRWNVPATATSQVTSGRRRQPAAAVRFARAEQRNDRSQSRPARLERAQQQDLLRLEEDVGHVVGIAVDAEPVAQLRVHRADGADHRAPERRRDQAEGPQPAFLDEVDEHVSLADAKPGARDALAAERGLTLDARDLQAGPLHRTGLRARVAAACTSGLSHARLEAARVRLNCCYTG